MDKLYLCLDRECKWQHFSAHYAHTNPSEFVPFIGSEKFQRLEQLKTERGRTCWNCGQQLIPTDSDHSYCDNCWEMMLAHPYLEEEDNPDICKSCKEPKDHKMHKDYIRLNES
jgi:hypothetical protein